MTQLVKKDSSWRTLRRKAVVGASSFALVAGMGVALAPAAMAADPVPPTVKIEAPSPAAIANDGTTASEDFTLTIDNSADNTVELGAGYQLRVTITVPDGASCVSVSDVAGLGVTGTGGAFTQVGSSCVFTTPFTASGANAYNIPSGTAAGDDTFALTLKGTSTTSAAITGAVKVSAQIDKVAGGSFQSVFAGPVSVDAQLVNKGAATFVESVVSPKFGSAYSATVVTSPGYPVTPSDDDADNTGAGAGDDGGYSAVGIKASNTTAAAWTSNPDEVRGADSDGYDVTVGSNTYTYISLNDSDTFTANKQTGFFFETTSGKIVFGTLDNSGSLTFTAKAVSSRDVASTYSWIIVANNENGGATAGDKSGLGKLTLLAGDVASPVFKLSVGFSDVSADNVFADAINELADEGIIRGYGDGSFGATVKVKRGEFAAFAYRTLDALGAISGSAVSGACTDAAPSVFSDVANTNVFCQEIKALAGLGIVNGTSATTFAPNADITRDQLAAFIYRMNAEVLKVQVQDAPKAATQFTDVPASNFASGDINWGTSNGVINGRTATTFDPSANTLRQEAAALLSRLAALHGGF